MKNFQEVIRNNLLKTNDSSRIFHGRGGMWPGFEHVVIDYFSPHLLITFYKDYDESFINKILETIKNIKELHLENILLQKRYLARPELKALKGDIPSNATANEHGSQYNLKFSESQNIGFFLDMSYGRAWLAHNSEDKKVLNLFSYTCSLSVAAIKGKADSVVNVDMSKAALAVGENNHRLNGIEIKKARFLPYDIMKSWNNILKFGPYDIVIIDPPTNQGDSFKVERDYYKIIKRLGVMTNPDAKVMACLNSPYLTTQFIKELFLEHAPEFVFEEKIDSAFSHMELAAEEGLKIAIFKKSQRLN